MTAKKRSTTAEKKEKTNKADPTKKTRAKSTGAKTASKPAKTKAVVPKDTSNHARSEAPDSCQVILPMPKSKGRSKSVKSTKPKSATKAQKAG